MKTTRHFTTALLFASAIVLAAASFASSGCATEDEEGILPEESATAELSADPEAKADRPSISFTTFNDTLPGNGIGEVRKLFTTAASYRSYFGHSAPASVNFAAGDWVMLYDAGRKNSGGYAATIQNIRRSDSGLTIKVTTRLSSPGEGCPVTLALTRPYVLARFRAPTVPRINWVQYHRDDVRAPSCVPASACATVRCASGFHCEEVQIQCITTPCNPIAECVPNVTCANVRCAAGTTCVQEGATPRCVPQLTCATVLCAPGTTCNDDDGTPSCDPIPGGCASNADCTLYDQYCPSNPCACEVLGHNQRPATCSASTMVQCFRQPCQGKTAVCQAGRCVVQ